MKIALLKRLLEAREKRIPVALISDLGSHSQRLVTRADADDHELSDALLKGFRFDESRVVKAGEREYFINIHNPPLKLIVVGAVHIAQMLIPIAGALNYDVFVIDPRGAFASEQRFPNIEIAVEWPDDVLPGIGLDSRTAMAVLTHDPKIDDPAIRAGLASECFYIGALGSKRTHAQRVERFIAEGFSDKDLRRIHAPIGLEIGARGASEIAVAIIAEMTKVLRLGPEAT
jgi:xanthine dehydrogenase accessory factor